MTGRPWVSRLRALAAEQSMSITQEPATLRLIAVRTGPGFPRRLTTTVAADTPQAWDAAARDMHRALEGFSVPNHLPPA